MESIKPADQRPESEWTEWLGQEDFDVKQGPDKETYKVTAKEMRFKVKVHVPGRYAASWGKASEENRFRIVKKIFITSLRMFDTAQEMSQTRVTATFESASRMSFKTVPLDSEAEETETRTIQGPYLHDVTSEFHALGMRIPLRRGSFGSAQTPNSKPYMGYGGNAAALALANTLKLPTDDEDDEGDTHIKHMRDIQATFVKGRRVKAEKVQDFLESVDAKKDKSRLTKEIEQQDPLEIIRKFGEKDQEAETEPGFVVQGYELRGMDSGTSTQNFVPALGHVDEDTQVIGFVTQRHKITFSFTGSKRYPADFKVEQSIKVGANRPTHELKSAISHQKDGSKDVYVTYLRVGQSIGHDADNNLVYQWLCVQDERVEEVLWSEVRKDLQKNGAYFGYAKIEGTGPVDASSDFSATTEPDSKSSDEED